MSPVRPSRPAAAFRRLALAALPFLAAPLPAQFVWGPGGAGGTGTWNLNQSNLAWFNGSTQVAWPLAGAAATFGGTGGNVTVTAVVATGLTFSAPGYSLAPAADTQAVITANTSTFTLDTASPASIAVTSLVGNTATTLVKKGAGKLTFSGALTGLNGVQVQAGELALTGTVFSDSGNRYTLADVAGAVLSFDFSTLVAIIGGLEGGGDTGGVMRPGLNPLTLTLAGTVDSTFAGRLEDNGSAALILAKTGTATQTLSGANTHSGATLVTGGTLKLAGNGSLLNSTVTVGAGATLLLDNSGTALASRLGDTRPVVLNGGTLKLIGHDSSAIAETTGALTLNSGQSRLDVTRTSGVSASLAFTGLTRLAGTALEFTGDGTARFTSAANTNGLLGGYAVVGNHWAALDGSGNIVAYSAYTSSLTTGAATDNVRLSAGQTLSAAATTRNSLALDASAGDFALSLGGSSNQLRLTSGGLLAVGAGTSSITGGTLTSNSTARDLVAYVRGNLGVASTIVDNSVTVGPVTTTFAVGLTKAGEGTLTLSGANTYTGDTRLLAGTLVVTGGAAIPDTSAVSLAAGTTLRLGGSTETVGGVSGTGNILLENGGLTIAGSGLAGTAAISLGSGRIVSASAANTEFSGAISGTGGLTHSGTGALTLSAAQTFTGALRVTAGSLLLLDEGLDILADTMPVELAGGTFGFNSNLAGLGTETLGTLAVASPSVLQFHSSTTLPTTFTFADSSALSWGGTLRVTNYTTSLDVLRFGTTASALTPAQLALIQFDLDGVLVPAAISSLGFVTPSAIPEPAAVAVWTGLGALACVLVRRRARRA